MEFAFSMVVVSSILDIATAATKCHDCSSWNPYCREKVDEPFESAVAAVECEKTSTCFLKKDETGVINRGCADWWMESQVDMGYIGCQTQHVPWLGEMVWCFCKEDYCNGGSIEMMANKVYPNVKDFPKGDWGDYEDWEEEEKEWSESSENEVDSKQESDKDEKWGDTGRKWGKGKTFDDLNPGYLGKDTRKLSDPKYKLWFWHADSDRPHWEKEQEGEGGGEGWRAPEWVEEEDGKGWDFPVTGNVHEHTAEETTEYHEYNDYGDTATASEDTTTTTETWDWGEGWGHIKPWWLRDDEEEEETTIQPQRWTPHATRPPRQQQQRQQQDDGFVGMPSKWGDDGWGDNSLDHDGVDVVIAKNDVIHDAAKQEFFCWDCYSDSPLCGDSVETQKANYLGKTSCSTTNKCFVRKDNGVIYRGCADGWTSSIIDTNYVGCRVQPMWNREVEWCFCTASLCNGDSMSQIIEKYEAQLEPFKASTPLPLTNMTSSNITITNSTTIDNNNDNKTSSNSTTSPDAPTVPQNRSIQSKKNVINAPAASPYKGKTTPKHLQKRSTQTGSDKTTDFHIGDETSDSTSSSPPASWQTAQAGSDVNGTEVNGTNYRALFG